MLYKDINERFTATVVWYISRGWRINTGSQRGSEGEIAKVDLTDGMEVIRIRIEKGIDCDSHIDYVSIITGRTTDTLPDKENIGTIWNERLKIISEERFYQVGRPNCNDSICYGTKEQAEEALKKVHARRHGVSRDIKRELSDKSYRTALSIIRRQKGCKTTKLSDISKVYAKVEYSRFSKSYSKHYYAVAKGKLFMLDNFCC